ncbi:hypothetical protein HNP38_002836 [Chryseobacterium defluvii]|uniref:Uncharacterized protein n=1 Tax=Chryseobacterium defluvii TaxID=160396 RepID=A0A840KJ51_9FLAO|nr:hypothetical protein [Chryseobacterium defluvii]MBB4807530.1 hypothetical protein [Chryseobacterium defluvii]
MKNKLFTIAVLSFCGFTASAQVGINTPTPSAMLDVVSNGNTASTKAVEINNSSANEMLTVLNNGNVGINVAAPSTRLHIVASAGTGFRLVDGSQAASKVLTSDANGVGTWQTLPVSSGGTVTSFSSGNLSPLFTTSVSNSTTTPSLAFSLSNAPANSIFGNNTGSAAAPTYFSASSLPINGDVTGTLASTTVVKINGSPLGTTTGATSGQVLTFNGTNWAPAALPVQSTDWRIDGNSDVTATNVSSSVGSATSSISNLKYLGTQNANDLVFAANGTIRGVINNANGSLTGGGTDGNSYFMWGSQNTAATTGAAVHTFNNAIIAGYKNSLINSNIIPSSGLMATVLLGKENSVSYNGMAIGFKNTVNGSMIFGNNNTGTSGIVVGMSNDLGSGGHIVIGRDFDNTVAPNTTLVNNSNIYASEYHFFQSQNADGSFKFSKIGVNTVPGSTQVADIKVSKAVQFVNDTTMTCNAASEGSIRYTASASTGHFEGCRRISSAPTFEWRQLNNP